MDALIISLGFPRSLASLESANKITFVQTGGRQRAGKCTTDMTIKCFWSKQKGQRGSRSYLDMISLNVIVFMIPLFSYNSATFMICTNLSITGLFILTAWLYIILNYSLLASCICRVVHLLALYFVVQNLQLKWMPVQTLRSHSLKSASQQVWVKPHGCWTPPGLSFDTDSVHNFYGKNF